MKTVEDLYLEYIAENSSLKKEKVLAEVIKCYNPLSYKLSSKFSKIFPSHEIDDWKILISCGIWEGLCKATSTQDVRKCIYYRIRHQISKEIQIITAYKRTYLREVEYDLTNYGMSEESKWISKIDIETAISKLPDKTREIIEFWMAGLPIDPSGLITSTFVPTSCDDCICKEVGLSFPAVYFRMQDAYDLLARYLKGYEGCMYE